MLPDIMKKMVYSRYDQKYRKWMERLGRELKRIELMSTKMKYRTKTCLRKVTL